MNQIYVIALLDYYRSAHLETFKINGLITSDDDNVEHKILCHATCRFHCCYIVYILTYSIQVYYNNIFYGLRVQQRCEHTFRMESGTIIIL